mmetsp:Transcript_7588/g.5735  ORF Transcript_7588/g.5735 Transcript_7588/m.5735 type:complete len:109 (+) Transcript_7588:540-866(+)
MVDKYPTSGEEHTYYTAIGMSMGANLMMKIAGEQGSECPFEAMVSINNPFDIQLGIDLMRKNPYEKYLAIEVRENMIVRKKNQTEEDQAMFKKMVDKYQLDMSKIKNV